MSEEQVQNEQVVQVDEKQVVETPTTNNEIGEYIAESKKYRQRAQTAEAELSELKANLKKQEQQQLEEKEEFKTLYESVKAENEQLKPVVEKFEIQEKQRREHLLSQLPEEEQELYNELSTINLEKHVAKLSNKKVQINDAKEVVSSGKFAQNTKYSEMSDEDREKARKNPTLWKQIVEGYSQ